MTSNRFSTLLAIALALSFAATGCKTHKGGESTPLGGSHDGADAPPTPPGGAGTMDAGPASSGNVLPGGGDLATFDPDQMIPDRQALAAQSIYFDYDSAAIRSDENSKLAAVAAALKSDPSAKLLIEGDCDERGTEEYNRSLGERRALAAREALAGQGVDAKRVATRSYGEDKPAVDGHDQAAWAKNRRDDFILLHPK